jgi:hypothetical protein
MKANFLSSLLELLDGSPILFDIKGEECYLSGYSNNSQLLECARIVIHYSAKARQSRSTSIARRVYQSFYKLSHN